MSASSGYQRKRSMSNHSNGATTPSNLQSIPENAIGAPPFEPCAATSSHFLFAQRSTVLCLHHDTLALQRRFSKHDEDISLISVDNVSERGAGRLVVTYDVGKTAIVWDLYSGEQLSRFASYHPLTVASWMRNGNIAFGNENGEVILFEPASSDHISARTIFDPITALAPASDCKTYAIGYRNGSILLAALQPQFTILHTLNTPRTPSPIALLTWHASSSKQKSDMLATQTTDGDLRIWSVPKPTTSGVPRVIRVLKESRNFISGRNWIAWSRNGRVLQYSEDDTLSWDVRTKEVTFQQIPTIPYVRALAAYGPTATLFTLGPENTIQQYDAESGEMVNNVRCAPAAIPPTPPPESLVTGTSNSIATSESEGELFSPSWHSRQNSNPGTGGRRSKTATPASRSRASSKRSDGWPGIQRMTTPGRTERTTTPFSLGTQVYGYPDISRDTSPAPSSQLNRKNSRLRNEVMKKTKTQTFDLLPFTKSRLSDVPYRPAKHPDDVRNMTADDLRLQMLSVVFGWEGDIEALIQDELNQHPSDSTNAVVLMKWLGYDADDLASAMGTSAVNPLLDWMRLALGTLENTPETKKIGQVFVEKMLSNGDVHLAAVVLLTMGDRNDAIEVYVSQHYYMEAVLLTCLLMPEDWQRLSHLVRKWGESSVKNSQKQQLAIRCFSCTGVEPKDPWTSPTAQKLNQISGNLHSEHSQDLWGVTSERPQNEAPVAVPQPGLLKPARTTPTSGSRMTPQTSSLKLITSFGPKPDKYQFPGLKSEDMTPTNPAYVTPIAESAIDRSALTPGGLGSYKMNNARSLNNALAATRHRLPSIGEAPSDVDEPAPPPRHLAPKAPPTPADSGSDKEKLKNSVMIPKSNPGKPDLLPTLLTPARYDPTAEPQTAVQPHTKVDFPSSITQEDIIDVEARSVSSRNRKPEGLSIHVGAAEAGHRDRKTHTSMATTDILSTTQFETDMETPLTTDSSYRVKSPSVSSRSIDQYISSLDQAQYYTNRTRSRNSNRASKEEKTGKSIKPQDQERVPKEINVASRRSPSSPIPMSPDDLRMYSQNAESTDDLYSSTNNSTADLSAYSGKHRRRESGSTTTTRAQRNRHRSRSTHGEARLKPSSRAASRRASPGPESLQPTQRGRSQSRKDVAATRSPSSPLPMVPSEEDLRNTNAGEGALRFVSQDRQRHRSTSRRPNREERSLHDSSSETHQTRHRSRSRHVEDREATGSRRSSFSTKHERKTRQVRDPLENVRKNAGSVPPMLEQTVYLRDPITRTSTNPPERSDRRAMEEIRKITGSVPPESSMYSRGRPMGDPMERGDRKKKLAQAELEARRESLARRPSAPAIPVPGQSGMHSKSASESMAPPPLFRRQTDEGYMNRHYVSQSSDLNRGDADQAYPGKERPTTPRAMQHPLHLDEEPIPAIPDRLETLSPSVYNANAPVNNLSIIAPPPDIPDNMPRHPAYDFRVQGRASSRGRGRDMSPNGRGKSRSRNRIDSGEAIVVGSPGGHDSENLVYLENNTYLPELQHLAVPPPPPPPPVFPMGAPSNQQLDAGFRSASVPLPRSIYGVDQRNGYVDRDKGHRRERSGNESNQFMGKIRDMAGKVRSASRNRDNMTRSPPLGGAQISAPYETIVAGQPQSLATVLESR